MEKFELLSAYVSNIGREGRIILAWKFINNSNSNYSFTIYRGENSENLLPISPSFNSSETDTYIDYTANTKDPLKIYYYKIKYEDLENNIYFSEIFNSKGNLDNISRFILCENNFKLKYISGTPCAYFKKIHEGSLRCSNCWNPLKMEAMKNNCHVCMGTGFINGYYKPIYCYIDLNAHSTSFDRNARKENFNEFIQAQHTDFPRMRRGDVISNLLTSIRYKVNDVQDELKGIYPLFQIVNFKLVNTNDVEYKLDVSEEMKIKAINEIQKRKI